MTEAEISRAFAEQVPPLVTAGERVLLIVPDATRTAPLKMLLDKLLPVLRDAGVSVRILVALGTHPPLTEDALRRLTGLDPNGDVPVINHAWDDPAQLVELSELSAAEVESASGGLMAQRVGLRVNRELTRADRILLLHPVFPHELVGFSGGAKYLFPGVSGPEMIDIVHWLGALRGSQRTIGLVDTPSRRVLNAAAAKLPLSMHGLSFVCRQGDVTALEIGDLTPAWERAARIAQQTHITYKQRQFRRALSCCPAMYPDFWTGGKCVYKVEPVVADGGELIVYAPHVRCFSEVHQEVIEQLGYHVRDYFLAHMDRYAHLPKAVMAYALIVKGDGTYLHGVETPRIRVSFASQIPREACEAACIGYVDPATIKPEDWRDREDEGVLLVEHAGEILYRMDKQGD
jgi:nickel-dependent lactate racemase